MRPWSHKESAAWVDFKTGTRWIAGAVIAGLSIAILWGFLKVLLWAAIIAVATWPIYRRFARHMPSSMASNVTPLLFTVLVALVVLGPPSFAFATLASHTQSWVGTMLVDSNEFVTPAWLSTIPVVGPKLVEQFHAHGELSAWLQHSDTTAVLGWLRSIGEFAGRHLFRIAFTVLLLFFVYRSGEKLAKDLGRFVEERVGDRANHYIELAIRGLRATMSSTLIVGVFDGVLIGTVCWMAGLPDAYVWGTLTGLLAAIPFLGYVAVFGAFLALVGGGSAVAAWAFLATGAVILFTGDKVVRPILVGSSTQLGFVWVLMGTIGGLELLGFIGIFVGPVVLALAGELWRERTTGINRDRTTQVTTGTVPAASQQMVEAHRPIANFASGQPRGNLPTSSSTA
jgi:predicted PurR-regulated permease PerM